VTALSNPTEKVIDPKYIKLKLKIYWNKLNRILFLIGTISVQYIVRDYSTNVSVMPGCS
jgi:hypothetical protein